MRKLLFAPLSLAFSLFGCSGELVGPVEDLGFVEDETTRVVVRSPDHEGFELRNLRGEFVKTLVRTSHALADVSARADRLLLLTPDSLIAVTVGGEMREIPLDPVGRGRYGGSLSAAGTRIAEAHWGGHRVRVWSFDTLELLHDIPCPEAQCIGVNWDATDEDILWLNGYSHHGFDRLDLKTGKFERVEPDAHARVRVPGERQLQHLERCRKTGARLNANDEGIELWEGGSPTRTIVKLRGKSDFIERRNAFDLVGFVSNCRYVFFEFRREYYLADVASGRIGPFVSHLQYVVPDQSGMP